MCLPSTDDDHEPTEMDGVMLTRSAALPFPINELSPLKFEWFDLF